MADIVLLEDSTDSAELSESQAVLKLTEEQRQRIAKQKELALARRSANQQKTRQQSAVIEIVDDASPAASLPNASQFSPTPVALKPAQEETSQREEIQQAASFPNGFRFSPMPAAVKLPQERTCEWQQSQQSASFPNAKLDTGWISTKNREALSIQQGDRRNKNGNETLNNGVLRAAHPFDGRHGYRRKQTDIIDVDGELVDEPPSEFQRRTSPYFVVGRKHIGESIDAIDSDGLRREEWRSVRKRPLFEDNCHVGPVAMKAQNHMLQQDAVHHSQSQSIPFPVQAQMKVDEQGTTASEENDVQKKPGKILLSSHQMMVLKAIAHKKSVFITGSAGTGKSFLLEFAVRLLKRAHGPESVFVTASTGLAACALGGTTLHSFAGIGLGLESKVMLAEKVKSKRDVRKRWMDAKALIIDEISMIDGELFDKLEYIASCVRRPLGTTKVFGGLQLIVTGDFFQLPPVNPENAQKYFAFEADCWNKCFDLQIEFTRVFRQSDSEFVAMLNELRKGHCSITTVERLQQCSRPVEDPDTGIILTRLYPRKTDVSRENDQNLSGLKSEKFPFTAKDVGKSEFAIRQLENVRAEKLLHLCVGAQVMLVKNLETSIGLVNGARGVIVKFIPVDDPSASEFKHLANLVSPHGVWPVVRFACDKVERLIGPESWSIMEGDREIAKRSQIPLILAWALSVHKCQGMTLDRVETDLSRAFDYGMVYVALSRVKSLNGLHLIGFDPSRIKVHPRVVEFYDGLKTEV